MSEAAVVLIVLAGAVVLFVSGRVPVEMVAVGSSLALWATGILDIEEALAGFGDPTVVFIASLFVVSEALDATGITAWVGQLLLDRAGGRRTRLMVLMMLACAALTALISVNGSVAALVPVVVVMAVRLRWPTSQLLMPLAFAAHAGSMLTLTGTPVNVVISEAAQDATGDDFGFFEFGLVGVPLVAGVIVIVVLLGRRLLPDRNAKVLPRDLTEHARTLMNHYDLERSGQDPLIGRRSGVAEVVIPPRSRFIGEPAFPGMVTPSGDLVVLAVQRNGQNQGPAETVLDAGDTLLVQGPWDVLDAGNPDVLVVDAPAAVRRQAVPFGPGAGRTAVVVAGMVGLLATGVVPAAVAGLVAAGTLILIRAVPIEQAYRSISWSTVVLVAGMTPLSTAMAKTGAAERIASGLIDVVGDAGPYAFLAALFVLTALLSQLISNMATALIVIPIAVSAAADLDVSARPVLMSLSVAAAAAVLTPVATPANMMVMSPGGYRFGDYWKLGLPVLVWFFVIAVGLVPVIWNF